MPGATDLRYFEVQVPASPLMGMSPNWQGYTPIALNSGITQFNT